MKINQLCQFIFESSKSGYGAGEEIIETKETDGSRTIRYENKPFRMHDNYFGGEPYGGRTVVFYKEKPCWMMVFYGRVDRSVADIENVYRFLRKALLKMPENHPFRGPELLKEGPFRYQNKWQGDIEDFAGEEEILKNGKKIYFAKYIGGLVDQRHEQ